MQRTEPPPAEFRHVYEFHLRFGDIDSQGHVNNVKFLGYLEDARLEMFHGDPVRKGEEPVRGMVIARHEIDYKLPLLPTVHPVRVETWVRQARAASFTLGYEVRDDAHVYATATSTIVAFDVEANRLRRFTPYEREFIGRYLAPAE
ncbi:acyl-CoA thioesterase [Actinomadura rayongensis]|uniref:Acyl-CoA thioesterase n=1 Tax=Actinomadura rayongensis TaxID=1429076 RepID=A0A6I4WAW8_9ACTN|nr:thioesterase family protein [Actinomadura rayongensis]MXQ65910.1 acyl-CoA thioesterase [Actinomadura rayongensis]